MLPIAKGSGWWRQSRSLDLPVGRSACGCEGSAPQAVPMQSLAAENLLCSFPAPRRSAAKARTALAAVPRSLPQLPAASRSLPQLPAQAERRARAGWWRRGPAAGQKGRLVSAPHLPGRLAGVACSPLSLYFRKKERGRKMIILRRVWEKLQPGRGLTSQRGAEGSNRRPLGGSGDPRSQCNIFYTHFFKVSVKLAGLFAVRSFQPKEQPRASTGGDVSGGGRWHLACLCPDRTELLREAIFPT